MKKLLAVLFAIVFIVGSAFSEEEALDMYYRYTYDINDDEEETQPEPEAEKKETFTSQDGRFTYVFRDDGSVSITDIVFEDADSFTVPASVDGYKVKAVDLSRIYMEAEVGSLILSDGIERFEGDYTDYSGRYHDCWLTIDQLVIPASVDFIDPSFYHDYSYIDLVFKPEGARYYWNDGVLFDGVEKALLYYPNDLTTEQYVLPADTLVVREDAFERNDSLCILVLNEGLKEIGDRAFAEIVNLESINIPASVEAIGVSSFSSNENMQATVAGERYRLYDGCLYDLRSMTLIDCLDEEKTISILPGTVAIGDKALSGNSMLETIEFIPGTLKSIGQSVFLSCRKLTNLVLPDGVETIGRSAFSGSGLVSVSIPGSVKRIPDCAFQKCSGLTVVKLNEGTEIIGEDAFYECPRLTGFNAPSSLRVIEDGAFMGCRNLVSVKLPKDFETIGKEAFRGCVNLYDFAFNEGLAEIGKYAFRECESLKTLLINDRLEKIGSGAFSLCRQLYLRASGDQPYFAAIDGSLYDKERKAILFYCDRDKSTEFIVPEGIRVIGSYAFENSESLERVILPTTLESIEKRAFYTVYNLREVVFQSPVRTIGEGAFFFCEHLKEAILPEGLEYIGSSAFSECQRLSNVILPDTLKEMESFAFNSCQSLKEITIPGSLKAVENRVFGDCVRLKKVTILEGVEFIDMDAFDNCDEWMTIEIPKSVTAISFESVYIPLDQVTFVAERDSYAHKLADEMGILCLYPDSFDWLTN